LVFTTSPKSGKLVADEAASAPALVKAASSRIQGESKHRWLERKPVQFMILSLVVILIGGLIEIVPMYLINSNVPSIASVQPYTPLELQGRDIYVREGCYTCHSQMIRPFRSETERYGEYSKAGEFVYDHPFQFGSKRNGPDLAREGVKTGKMYKPNSWHYNHFENPQKLNAQSIMPSFRWLLKDDLDISTTPAKIRAMQCLGVPYPAGYDLKANDDLMKQAQMITDDLKASGINASPNKEVIALIAYIQRLGTDITKSGKVAETNQPKP
jgi:cytochrome c oxidase cbb3-type subunit I/II